MSYDPRRGMVSDIKSVSTGVSRRIQILISNEPTNRNPAPADPYDKTNAEPPPENEDTVVYGAGSFEEQKVQDEFAELGKQIVRKAIVECHPMYEKPLLQGYALKVSGESGRWKIRAVKPDTVRMRIRVLIESMD